MLDFVFTVDDPVMWHSKNLKKNWSHYSFLKILGPRIITSIQNNYGAGVYYNPLITCDGRLIKYGVISTSVLIEDLLNWNTLYVAGRLQKPVKIVAMNENVTLRSALDKNLRSAVTAAFLMLPESFSEEDLFVEIAGLSYSGDFRMVVGEEKTKVWNIVKPNVAHFRELYGSILQENPQVVYKTQQGRLEIDKSPEGQFSQLMTLPKTLQQRLNRIMDPPGKNRDVEETLLQLAHDPDCGDVVRLGLSAIVRPSSIRQSTKGIFTAGKNCRKSLYPPHWVALALGSDVKLGPVPWPGVKEAGVHTAERVLQILDLAVEKHARLVCACPQDHSRKETWRQRGHEEISDL